MIYRIVAFATVLALIITVRYNSKTRARALVGGADTTNDSDADAGATDNADTISAAELALYASDPELVELRAIANS